MPQTYLLLQRMDCEDNLVSPVTCLPPVCWSVPGSVFCLPNACQPRCVHSKLPAGGRARKAPGTLGPKVHLVSACLPPCSLLERPITWQYRALFLTAPRVLGQRSSPSPRLRLRRSQPAPLGRSKTINVHLIPGGRGVHLVPEAVQRSVSPRLLAVTEAVVCWRPGHCTLYTL